MILDEIVLHDFGVYGGRQSIVLTPPDRARPIILFGGLNGGGKTTLLDALQLCLYGQAARCSNRKGLAYDEYLRRCIHRHAATAEAALEIAFRHTCEGREESLRIHRSWKATGTGIRESFHVLRDGAFDQLATDHWSEQVEDFLPARIAHLFLFDGENVEGYAEAEEAPALIATAIHNLLGLDLVERLGADLGVYERRRRSDLRGPEETRALESVEAELARLQDRRVAIVGEKAASLNLLDRATAAAAAADDRYRREGGDLYEKVHALEQAAESAERRLMSARVSLQDLAAEDAPLLMVEGLLGAVMVSADRNRSAQRDAAALSAIEEEHGALMRSAPFEALSRPERAAFRKMLGTRLEARRRSLAAASGIHLGNEAALTAIALRDGGLAVARARLVEAVAEESEAAAELANARDTRAAAPGADAIAGPLATRDEARAAVAALIAERDARNETAALLDREIATLEERRVRLAQAEAQVRFAQDDVQRILTHSAKVRDTLGRFRQAVVQRHVSRIEGLVLDAFGSLSRKRTLVTGLRIDPVSFALSLVGPEGEPLTPDRLSAGERQLLAIAILWGLGRSSGRPLPTVIDTPLGRLDSTHRTRLVERYFPNASHQVLLLSTDEEIAGPHYETLRPSIGRSYHLRYDEAERRTVVEDGYLAASGAMHVH